MTRDEAIATVAAIWGGSKKTSSHQVDTLSALGILKLDEPKSVQQRLAETPLSIGTIPHGYSRMETMGSKNASRIIMAVNEAGLRIVEK